jgi:hypothetical protein
MSANLTLVFRTETDLAIIHVNRVYRVSFEGEELSRHYMKNLDLLKLNEVNEMFEVQFLNKCLEAQPLDNCLWFFYLRLESMAKRNENQFSIVSLDLTTYELEDYPAQGLRFNWDDEEIATYQANIS